MNSYVQNLLLREVNKIDVLKLGPMIRKNIPAKLAFNFEGFVFMH